MSNKTTTPVTIETSHKECGTQRRIKANSRRDQRSLAFQYLYALDRGDYQTSLPDIVSEYQEQFTLDDESGSFAQRIVAGVIEHRVRYDQRLSDVLTNWDVGRIGCCTRLVLYVALWELEYEDVPPRVVINEALELARSFAEVDAYRIVNGVLDRLYKEDQGSEGNDVSERSEDTKSGGE